MGSLSERWAAGESEKDPFLRRARMFAAVTLPHLAPDLMGAVLGEDLPSPSQGLGARGVSNLASRLTLGLFPAQSPFFRYEIDPVKFREVLGGGDQGALDLSDPEIQRRLTAQQLSLARREREIQRVLDVSGFRARAYEAFLHLIVSGNYLLRFNPEGVISGFRIDQFNLERDPDGVPEWLLVREVMKRERLPEEVRSRADPTTSARPPGRDEVDLYTAVERTGDGWTTWQEAGNTEIPGSRVEGVPDGDLPWLPLRFLPDSNEDYGRSYADITMGDVRTHEGLTQAINDAAALAARVLYMVDPSLPISPDRLAHAETGDYLPGNADLVRPLTASNIADMTVAANARASNAGGLELAFLLRSAVRRDGERVTATEVMQIAQELDETLAGVFGLQSVEFQAPLVEKLERLLVRSGRLADQQDIARVRITTGMDALGRGREAIQLRTFLADAQAVFGDQVPTILVGEEYLRRLAVAQGIDPEGLIRTPEETAQITQQNQMSDFIQKVGPEGIRSMTALAQQQQGGGQAQ